MGARFSQYTAELATGGTVAPGEDQRFLYVLQGSVRVGEHLLEPGGYAFLPEGTALALVAMEPSRITVIEKPYDAVEEVDEPRIVIGTEQTVVAQPLMNDPWLEVRTLLPSGPEFDCAVNTMTFRPGASLPIVEVHVMEHGLLMLEGSGIYRLGDCWYPVHAGDFIWMAPYCPQWFAAIGKTPAKYLLYKDWNRGPWAGS